MNLHPQETSYFHSLVSLSLTDRVQFTDECDDSEERVSELCRLLLYRLGVLEAALQRVARICSDAADGLALKTLDRQPLLDRVSEILHRFELKRIDSHEPVKGSGRD